MLFKNGLLDWLLAIAIMLVLAYPMGYMSLPTEFTFIQKFVAGSVLSWVFAAAVVMFAAMIRLKIKLRREERQQRAR